MCNVGPTGPRPLILIVGSGPDAPGWLERWQARLDAFDQVFAINHAWILMKRPYIWAHSIDVKQDRPAKGDPMLRGEVTGSAYAPYKETPNYYAGGRTMLLSVTYHALNSYPGAVVGVIGNNLTYEGPQTHFYGTGGKDPLRYGLPWLTRNLSILDKAGELYNLSPVSVSLLPFKKAALDEFISRYRGTL